MNKYYQCTLRKGSTEMVTYIPERGAMKGCGIELKGEDGYWTVVDVGDKPVSEEWLLGRAKENRNMKNFPSLN